MSYCRWSSNGFKCDLYVYEDVNGGFTIHVANNRITDPCPEIDFTNNATIEETLLAYNAWMKSEKNRVKIGLPFDGQTFNVPTAQDCLDKMLELREAGYNFPDYAIESLLEEIRLLDQKS